MVFAKFFWRGLVVIAAGIVLVLIIKQVWTMVADRLFLADQREYRNDELGFAFNYPAAWGEVQYSQMWCVSDPSNHPLGDQFLGKFEGNKQCIFGGVVISGGFGCPLSQDKELSRLQDLGQSDFSTLAAPDSFPDEYSNPAGIKVRTYHSETDAGWIGTPGLPSPGKIYAHIRLPNSTYPDFILECSGSRRKGPSDVSRRDQKGFDLIVETFHYTSPATEGHS